jgi:hypothetical protein
MVDQPQPEQHPESFAIPQPRVEKLNVSAADTLSLAAAAQEYRGYLSGSKTALTRSWWDWIQVHLLKWILFAFVIWINVWWTRNVLRMVWLSGSSGSYFHLDNTVLIALVSTSIANFLALVVVVAKNLFPDYR